MDWQNTPSTAFQGSHCLASGALKDVALVAKTAVDDGAKLDAPQPVLIFNDTTSEVIELDWRGSRDEFAARFERLAQSRAATANDPATAGAAIHAPTHESQEAQEAGTAGASARASPAAASTEAPRGPGRPRLGVVAREVTLLPRHWEWLATQSGGASVALRKLVEVARRTSDVKDRVRQASEAGYRFMSTMAGQPGLSLAGFEEASRALFAGDQAGFEALIADWPADVQTHLKKLLADAFWA